MFVSVNRWRTMFQLTVFRTIFSSDTLVSCQCGSYTKNLTKNTVLNLVDCFPLKISKAFSTMFRISRLKYKHGQNGIISNLFVKQSTAAAAASQASSSSSADEVQRIVIPKRVKRGPTDLLYTLSKTVGRDPTAAHFKYHDDPFLMPTSLFNREQFALSQESGRQTAKWIKQEHAKLFNVSN